MLPCKPLNQSESNPCRCNRIKHMVAIFVKNLIWVWIWTSLQFPTQHSLCCRLQLYSGLQYVCMQINTYINTYILTASVSFAFICTGHICTATAHRYTFISPFLCVCFFFVVVERATSSQRTTAEGQVRLAAPAAQTALYVQCRCSASLLLTSPGVGQQMEHLERELTYGSQLSSWSLHGKSSLYFQEQRDESHSETFNWRWQAKVGYLWF